MNDNTMIARERPIRVLRRSRDDRMIAGVCGGAAKLLGVDARCCGSSWSPPRSFGFGTGALCYLVCWIVVPEE